VGGNRGDSHFIVVFMGTVLTRGATAARAFRVTTMTPAASTGQSTRCASSPTPACRLAPRCMGAAARAPAIHALCWCAWHVLRCISARMTLDARGGPVRQCSCTRYTNGAFYVDMPRGCITVMHSGGYAAAGLKHCVRPVDMAGEPPTYGGSKQYTSREVCGGGWSGWKWVEWVSW